MVSWQAFPSLPPSSRAPARAFLSPLKLPFPPLSNASQAGYLASHADVLIIRGSHILNFQSTAHVVSISNVMKLCSCAR